MVFPEKARKPCTSVVWVHYSTWKPHENNNFASFDLPNCHSGRSAALIRKTGKMFQILYSNLTTIWILDQVVLD